MRGCDEGEKFSSATAMVAWWFATRGHFESVAAVDPSADVIQGLRVDRTERAWWSHAIRQALREAAKRMGSSSGVLLLWLHLRPRSVVGYRRKRGVRVAVFDDPIPLWDLYQHPTVEAYHLGGQRRVVARYWEALREVERVAVERGWLPRRSMPCDRLAGTHDAPP